MEIRLSLKQLFLIVSFIFFLILLYNSTAQEDNWSSQIAKSIGLNHAIIIGIDHYENFDDIKGPSNDAEALYQVLTTGYHFDKKNISLLTSMTKDKPTTANIIDSLAKFLPKSQNESFQNDNLIIFYSGRSEEDENDTYWITADSQSYSMMSHKEITNKFFKKFRLKHLLIVSDSFFNQELISSTENQIFVNDFQYLDWIMEYGQKFSRKIIFSDDNVWSTKKIPETGLFDDSKFKGFDSKKEFIGVLSDNKDHTLFFTYLIQALQLNKNSVIDIENLLFDFDDIFQPFCKKTGSKIKRGKLRDSMDKDGLFVFVKKPPVIKLLEASTKIIEQGEPLTIIVKTDFPVNEVIAKVNDEIYPFEGDGLNWQRNLIEPQIGKYKAFVEASIDEQNRSYIYPIDYTVTETCPTIEKIDVTPDTGKIGDTFHFSAQINVSAHHVSLTIDKRKYNMSGSDTKWLLDIPLEKRGRHSFSIEAFNSQNISKKPKIKTVTVLDQYVEVISSKVITKDVFIGDKFIIEAETDHSAQLVNVSFNNTVYPMRSIQNDKKKWRCSLPAAQAGQLFYSVQAQNAENELSAQKQFSFMVYKKIPKILSVMTNPDQITEGEIFSIEVLTTPADKVNARINDHIYSLKGNGEHWSFAHAIHNTGKAEIEIIAQNTDSTKTVQRLISINISKKTYPVANISDVKINPQEGTLSDNYQFLIKTSANAEKVILEIDQKMYLLNKKEQFWTTQMQFSDYGNHPFNIVAINHNQKKGEHFTGSFHIPYPDILISSIHYMKEPVEGEQIRIEAQTDRPATQVHIKIDGKTYPMKGSLQQWYFDFLTEKSGKQSFQISAFNEDNKNGPEKYSDIWVKERPIFVKHMTLNPSQPFVNESFELQILTNVPIHSAELTLNNKQYRLEGSDTQWKSSLRFSKEETVKGSITIHKGEQKVHKEIENFQVVKKILDRPNVLLLKSSPDQGFQDDKFKFTATTDIPADIVFIEIQGKQHQMKGAGKNWTFNTTIQQYGLQTINVEAYNKDGNSGVKGSVLLQVKEHPVIIQDIFINPQRIFAEDPFTVTVHTNKTPKAVWLDIQNETYSLNCKQTTCQLPVRLQETGKIPFRVFGVNNENLEGKPRQSSLIIYRPKPEISSVKISPDQPESGETIKIIAKTRDLVDQITAVIDNHSYPMIRQTDLKYQLEILPPIYGNLSITLTAKNNDSQETYQKVTQLFIKSPKIQPIKFSDITIKPSDSSDKWYSGNEFTFTAETDSKADSVQVKIGNKPSVSMEGSGKKWHLSRKIIQTGMVTCTFIAKVQEQLSKKIQLVDIQTPPSEISSIVISPKKGYVGDIFQVRVETLSYAYAVMLEMNGKRYQLLNKSNNKIWETRLTGTIPGVQTITCYSENEKNIPGNKSTSMFNVFQPLSVPNISSVTIKPDKEIFIEDIIQINVETTASAKSVYIKIDDQSYNMKGSDRSWQYSYSVNNSGKTNYIVVAENQQNRYGKEKEGFFISRYPLIKINSVNQSPSSGTSSTEFDFSITTDRPAKKVVLTFNNNEFALKGENRKWQIKKSFPGSEGSVRCQFLAFNSENHSGESYSHSFEIESITPENRFVDNNDETITDRKTGLIWSKKPHFTYLKYDEATSFCRKLNLGNSSEWRLPTIDEWKNLVDRKNRAPALPAGYPFELFSQLDENNWKAYWSKSKYRTFGSNVWVMDLRDGKPKNGKKRDQYIAWPVRAR